MLISTRAADVIIVAEVSGQAAYTAKYQHFTRPGGNSGPTAGIGYDCGYVTPDEIRADWGGITSGANVAGLLAACGKRGAVAQSFVNASRTLITIPWGEAIAEFEQREVPKWEARCRHALPNFDMLAADSAGAILSLTYNRGTSYDLEGDRYREMRAIKAHMIAKAFDQIPAEILSMRRLWAGNPQMRGLVERRATEAALFRDGLGRPAIGAAVSVTQKPAPAPAPAPVPVAPAPAPAAPAPALAAPAPSWLEQAEAFADRLFS